MLAIAQEGCMNTGRESALKVDYVKKIQALSRRRVKRA